MKVDLEYLNSQLNFSVWMSEREQRKEEEEEEEMM